SRRRHTRSTRDWSSDVCSSDLGRLDPFPLHFQKTGKAGGFVYNVRAKSYGTCIVRTSQNSNSCTDEDTRFAGNRPMKKYSILLSVWFLLVASMAANAQYTGAWSTTWNNQMSATATVRIKGALNRNM